MHVIAMGPGQNSLIRVGSGQPSMVWVWKISPKNVKLFIFYPSGFFKQYPGQKRVSLLFIAYARVGSGQGPSLACQVRKALKAD